MSPKTCYRIGAVLLLSGLFHLSMLITSGDTWTGPLSWRKPATFGLSFGLTLITIVWVASYLPLSGRARRGWLGAFAVACAGEVALITVQAWRRVPSHFNMETPLDTAIARVLAAGGAVLIIVIAALTIAAFRRPAPVPGASVPGLDRLAPVPGAGVPALDRVEPESWSEPEPESWSGAEGLVLTGVARSAVAPVAVAPSMRLAVRAGFLALDSALLVGAVMIVIGVTDVVGGDQQAAYQVGAQWKPAHFVPMHGVLALPLLAWLLSRTGLAERARVRIVALAAAGYGVLCVLAIGESIAAVDPLHAPLAANAVALAAALAILAAAAQTLAALRHTPRVSVAVVGGGRSPG